jgi:Stage II sporulation protein E (SpoIIE)
VTACFSSLLVTWMLRGLAAAGSGRLEWSCAGHPRPLLRGRNVVAELGCDPTLPFGLGDGAPEPGIEELEPDDAVLLYTDGVVEARTPDGELFGLDRLADLLEREAAAAGRPKNCCAAWCLPVLEHQAGGLRDDATLLLMQWTGTRPGGSPRSQERTAIQEGQMAAPSPRRVDARQGWLASGQARASAAVRKRLRIGPGRAALAAAATSAWSSAVRNDLNPPAAR